MLSKLTHMPHWIQMLTVILHIFMELLSCENCSKQRREAMGPYNLVVLFGLFFLPDSSTFFSFYCCFMKYILIFFYCTRSKFVIPVLGSLVIEITSVPDFWDKLLTKIDHKEPKCIHWAHDRCDCYLNQTRGWKSAAEPEFILKIRLTGSKDGFYIHLPLLYLEH